MQRISGADRVFWLLESAARRQKIQCLVLLDAVPNPAEIKARAKKIAEYFPPLSCKLADADRLVWERVPEVWSEELFQFQYRPEINDREQLLDQAAVNLSAPFDLSQPLWEVRLIANRHFAAPGRDGLQCALSVAVHHAIADGIGGFELIRALSDGYDFSIPARRLEVVADYNRPRALAELYREFRKPTFPKVLASENETAQRRIMAATFPTELYQGSRRKFGCTLNDCLLAHTALALGLWLGERGAEFVGGERALLPISLRAPGEARALGNRLCATTVVLPLQAAGLAQILPAICEQTAELRSARNYGAFALAAEYHHLIPRAFQRRAADLPGRWTNLICSNFSNQRAPLKFCEAVSTELVGSVALLSGHALGLLFGVHAGKVTFGITADKAISAATLPSKFCQAAAAFSASNFQEPVL